MSYHVKESIEIDADRGTIFEAVADLQTWTKWSPWLCCDKGAKVTVTANPNSEGSMYHWVGTVVGEGEIQHEKLSYGELIKQELRFIKPFRSTSQVWFEITNAGAGTKVIWHMKGNLPWFLFWMKPNIQRFISMDFRRGLKMLAEYVQHGSVASDTTVGDVEYVGPFKVVGLKASCQLQEIGPSMDATLGKLAAKLKSLDIPMSVEMISIYDKMDLKTQRMDYTAGYVVPTGLKINDSTLAIIDIPKTKALTLQHRGRYEHLGNAWSAAHANLRSKKLKINKSCGGFEIYRNSPVDTDPQDLITDLYIPVR